MAKLTLVAHLQDFTLFCIRKITQCYCCFSVINSNLLIEIITGSHYNITGESTNISNTNAAHKR